MENKYWWGPSTQFCLLDEMWKTPIFLCINACQEFCFYRSGPDTIACIMRQKF